MLYSSRYNRSIIVVVAVLVVVMFCKPFGGIMTQYSYFYYHTTTTTTTSYYCCVYDSSVLFAIFCAHRSRLIYKSPGKITTASMHYSLSVRTKWTFVSRSKPGFVDNYLDKRFYNQCIRTRTYFLNFFTAPALPTTSVLVAETLRGRPFVLRQLIVARPTASIPRALVAYHGLSVQLCLYSSIYEHVGSRSVI